MCKRNRKYVVLTAGGTGGHVYPAEALAWELEKRGYEVELYTDARGIKNYKGKLTEIKNKAICSGGVVGKSIVAKMLSLCKVGIGVLQAIYCLILRRPLCVVGFGGYASFPTAVAAVVLRIPLIVHEQNSVMSRTNRILARYATLVAQSFNNTLFVPKGVKTILCGMPIRENIVKLYEKKYDSNSEKVNIVVLGGSQGAKVFSEVVPESVGELSKTCRKKLCVYQQCRKGDEDVVKNLYERLNCEAVVNSFFENMPELYENATITISRAGASSVYEIAAAGVPAVFVPLPTAADNHQYYNAKEFADAGSCVLVNQSEFSALKLKSVLEDLIENRDKLKVMADSAKKVAIVDAAKRLADAVDKVY